MAILIVEAGERLGEKFLLDNITIIGRLATNPIHIEDDRISREHAKVTREPDGFYIVDLDSRNGTLVNGERIKLHKLIDDDLITIGHTHLRFKEVDEAPVEQPAGRPSEEAMKTAPKVTIPTGGEPTTSVEPTTRAEIKSELSEEIDEIESKSPSDVAKKPSQESVLSKILLLGFSLIFFIALLLLSKRLGEVMIDRMIKSQPKTKTIQPEKSNLPVRSHADRSAAT